MMLNKNLQEININNMDVELVAQMFKNYQSNVMFHLEGELSDSLGMKWTVLILIAVDGLKDPA